MWERTAEKYTTSNCAPTDSRELVACQKISSSELTGLNVRMAEVATCSQPDNSSSDSPSSMAWAMAKTNA